eukprot:Em0002g1498a
MKGEDKGEVVLEATGHCVVVGKEEKHCKKPFCNNCYKLLYGPEGTKLLESKEEQQEFNLSPELMARSQDVCSKLRSIISARKTPEKGSSVERLMVILCLKA